MKMTLTTSISSKIGGFGNSSTALTLIGVSLGIMTRYACSDELSISKKEITLLTERFLENDPFDLLRSSKICEALVHVSMMVFR
jgi:hypothetical protein